MAEFSRTKLREELEGQLSSNAAENPSFRDEVIFGLLDLMDQTESDIELQELLRVQNSFLSQTVEAKGMPTFSKALHTEPAWGKEKTLDMKKMFGENALDEWMKVPWADIKYMAEQYDMDPMVLAKELREQGGKERRRKIAHGEDLGGWFASPASFAHNLGGSIMTLLAPRAQEAIERGEDPEFKDYALDALQNAAYTLVKIPGSGKALSAIQKSAPKVGAMINSTGGKLAGGLASNARNPILMEVADDIAYDDEENARSDASLSDVITGTGVNVLAPILTKGVGMKLSSLNQGFGKKDRTIGKMLENWGEGETPAEIADKIHYDWLKGQEKQALEKVLPGSLSQETWKNLPGARKLSLYEDRILRGIASQPGKNFREKFAKFEKTLSPTEKEHLKFKYSIEDLVALYRESGYPIAEGAKTATQRQMEQGSAGFLVNELGDNVYSDNKSRIGVMLPYIGEALEALEEKQAEDEYNRNKRKAFERWGNINFLGE